MSRKHTAFCAPAALVGGFLAAQGATTPPSGSAQQTQPGQAQPGHGMMGGTMGMMGQMDPPAQMNWMMENCNKMTEGMNRAPGGSGHDPSAPAPNPRRG